MFFCHLTIVRSLMCSKPYYLELIDEFFPKKILKW